MSSCFRHLHASLNFHPNPTMRRNLYLLVATVMLAFGAGVNSGCATKPIPQDLTQSDRTTLIKADDRLDAVRVTAALASSNVDVKQLGITIRFNTGDVFRQVFAGSEGSPLVMELIQQEMKQQTGLWTASVNYSVTVKVSHADKAVILSATGLGSTAWTLDRGAREAVEQAVLNIKRQVQASFGL